MQSVRFCVGSVGLHRQRTLAVCEELAGIGAEYVGIGDRGRWNPARLELRPKRRRASAGSMNELQSLRHELHAARLGDITGEPQRIRGY